MTCVGTAVLSMSKRKAFDALNGSDIHNLKNDHGKRPVSRREILVLSESENGTPPPPLENDSSMVDSDSQHPIQNLADDRYYFPFVAITIVFIGPVRQIMSQIYHRVRFALIGF